MIEQLINDLSRVNQLLTDRNLELELESQRLKEENKKAYQTGFNEGASAAATDIMSTYKVKQ